MQHTPGPWTWSIDLRNRDIRLNAGSFVVMDFVRYGMQGAQPRFRLPEYGDILIECADLAKEHSLRQWPHPDARLIAAAPELLAACAAQATLVRDLLKLLDTGTLTDAQKSQLIAVSDQVCEALDKARGV